MIMSIIIRTEFINFLSLSISYNLIIYNWGGCLDHRFERIYLDTTRAYQHRKFLGNCWILWEQLIDLKEFFKAVLTSMHSLI
jgi:hypothetical protein